MGQAEDKKFVAKPGQTDYTNIREAPVINSVVEYGGHILLVRRSDRLNFYPDHWSGISGFLDDGSTPEQKIKEEIREELGFGEGDIQSIEAEKMFEVEDKRYDKKWLVHPLRVVVLGKEPCLNWEAEDYARVLPHEIHNYHLVPGYDRIVEMFYPSL